MAKTQYATFTLINPDTHPDEWLQGELDESFGSASRVEIIERIFDDPEDRLECRVAVKVVDQFGFDKDELADTIGSIVDCDDVQAEGAEYSRMTAEAFGVTDKDKSSGGNTKYRNIPE